MNAMVTCSACGTRLRCTEQNAFGTFLMPEHECVKFDPTRDEVPLPWRAVNTYAYTVPGSKPDQIRAANNGIVAWIPRASDAAERIIRAVNGEARLREALRDLLEDIANDREAATAIRPVRLQAARAALAASEEE